MNCTRGGLGYFHATFLGFLAFLARGDRGRGDVFGSGLHPRRGPRRAALHQRVGSAAGGYSSSKGNPSVTHDTLHDPLHSTCASGTLMGYSE